MPIVSEELSVVLEYDELLSDNIKKWCKNNDVDFSYSIEFTHSIQHSSQIWMIFKFLNCSDLVAFKIYWSEHN